jgi:NADPH-dependent curcumin reductase CurA
MSEINRRWLLAERPKGKLTDAHFRKVEEPIPTPGPGEFVVRVTHLSFDPTQRVWITADTYLPAVKVGEVVRAGGAGQVVASNHPDYPVGALVQGGFGWQDFCLTTGKTDVGKVSKLFPGITPEQALGVFGLTGVTAYFGLTDVGKPQPGETVVVSGAAGATGSVAGQIAKAMGCTVIGIAGGPEKCAWVTGEAGFDHCIDYKNDNVAARLRALAPKGVNVVFENVGGAILDASLMNIADRARIVLCGAISTYDEGPGEGIKFYSALTVRRAKMEGFIVLDYANRYGEAVQALAKLLAEGKLKALDDVQEGFDNIPATLRRLFEGKNFGKQLLKIADPPLPVT